MAITLTEVAETASTSNTNSYNSGTFTRTSTRSYVVFVGATGTVHTNPIGTHSTTMTRERVDILTTAENAVFWIGGSTALSAAFNFSTAGSPGDDPATGSCIYAVEADGASTTAPIVQSAFDNGAASTTPSVTLGDPVTPGNALLISITAFNLSPLGAAFTSAGFTEMSTAGGFGYTSPLYQMQVFKHESPGAVTTITADAALTQAWRMTVVEIGSATQSVSLPLVDNSAAVLAATTQTVADDLLNNTFDAGTNGATITTGNSGGANGDAFNSVVIGGTGTLVYDTTNAIHGTTAAAVNPAAAVADYVEWSLATLTTMYARWYVKLSALPGSNMPHVDFRDSGTSVNRGRLTIQTDGRIRLVDGAGTTVATTPNNSTGTLVAGAYARLEAKFVGNATTGSLELKMFLGANVEGSTADSTTTASNINTVGSVDRWRLGQTSSGVATDTAVFYLDQLQLSTSAYPGAYVASNQTVDLPLNATGPAALISSRFNIAVSLPTKDNSAALLGAGVSSSANEQTVSLPLIGFGWDTAAWSTTGWAGDGGNLIGLTATMSVAPALKDNSATTNAHSVNPNQPTLPLISNVAATIDPQFRQRLEMSLVDNSAALIEAAVQTALEVALPLKDQSATVLTADVDGKFIALPLVDQSASTIDPRFNQAVSMSLVDNSAAVQSLNAVTSQPVILPLVDQSVATISADFRTQLDATLLGPVEMFQAAITNTEQTVEAALLDQSVQMFDLSDITTDDGPQTVTVSLLASSATTLQPRMWNPLLRQIVEHARYRPVIYEHARYRPSIYKQAREASLVPERSDITKDDGFFIGEDQSVKWDIPASDLEGQDLGDWTGQFRLARTQDGTSILTKSATMNETDVEIEVSFAAADTSGLAASTYWYTLSRTNSGQNTVLAWGKCVLQARVQ